jgi:hypothetical protein
MTGLVFHGGGTGMEGTGPLGSPMYDLMGDHEPALVAMGLGLIAVLVFSRFGRGSVADRYRALPLSLRFAILLLSIDGAAHFGLAFHADAGLRVAFLFSTVGAAWVIGRLLTGRKWRLLAGLLMGGALIGYWVELLRGHPPDQVGLIVKLIELVALWLILQPAKTSWLGWRRAGATSLMALGLFLNTVFVWAGAFGGNGAEAATPLDHHVGAMVTPGMVMLPHDTSTATAEQTAEADALWNATHVAIARYADPRIAALDGYRVAGLAGDDFHAPNPSYQRDGRVLDPARPENLIYAMGPDGPVLMGAMFETQGLAGDPPATGGPLLHWHRHEQVCVSLTPPGLAGLVDPQGLCPVGALALPITGSMMHVWTVPGAPERFGDLDEAWKRQYLDSLAG